MIRSQVTRRVIPYTYAVPGLLLLIVMLVYPIGRGFYYSLHKYNLATFEPMTYIGLQNYDKLFSDALFKDAFEPIKEFIRIHRFGQANRNIFS